MWQAMMNCIYYNIADWLNQEIYWQTALYINEILLLLLQLLHKILINKVFYNEQLLMKRQEQLHSYMNNKENMFGNLNNQDAAKEQYRHLKNCKFWDRVDIVNIHIFLHLLTSDQIKLKILIPLISIYYYTFF